MERARHESYGRAEAEEPPRIIDLGDVRRRNGSHRRGLPDPHRLIGMVVVALFAWVVWTIVLLAIPPSRLLTYIAFCLPLWAALAATCAAVLYLGQYRMGFVADARSSVRRGMLVGAVAVANLVLLAAHHWSVPAFVGTGVLACGADFLRQRRAA